PLPRKFFQVCHRRAQITRGRGAQRVDYDCGRLQYRVVGGKPGKFAELALSFTRVTGAKGLA
ncbi:MAG: hypothetical protein OXN26_11600, partial [Gammaproteobacteria bacterium]|nr:hypothetical protein [Gammaproteobacteria bacterium]